MSRPQRAKFSFKFYITKVLLMVAVLFAVLVYYKHDNGDYQYQLNQVAYLYDGNEMVGVNQDEGAEELVSTYKDVGDKALDQEITEDGEEKSLNTQVISSPSLVTYNVSDQTQIDNIDYVKQNTEVLEEGFTITVDGKYKYYVPNRQVIVEAAEDIMLAYVPNKSYVEYYETTGNFKEFTEDDITYTGISIDNDIIITKGYQNGSTYVDTAADLQFELLHKKQNKETEYISDDVSIKSIMDDNDLTTTEFKLNNPTLSTSNLTYNSQPIVVNQIDPIINIVQTAEQTKSETVEYAVVTEEDPDLATGEFEVKTPGEEGEKDIVYEQQIVNGEVVEETQISQTVTKEPVHQVVSVGEGTTLNSLTVNSDGEIVSTNSNQTSSGMIWPSDGSEVTCEYGGYSGHTGIDIQNYYGAPEYAVADGVVVESGWSIYGYGYHVVIDHGNGIKTLYGHQNQVPPVSVGQTVEQGQVIGFEGATGNVTGEHLHFEVIINGTAVNPRPYITSEPAYNMGTVCS